MVNFTKLKIKSLILDFNSSPRERTEHLTSLRVKSVLGEGLTNCARNLDPHQEIQVLTELKPNFYPLPMERRGKWYMELSRLSTPPVVKRGKCGLEILCPSTPPVVKRGKGVKG